MNTDKRQTLEDIICEDEQLIAQRDYNVDKFLENEERKANNPFIFSESWEGPREPEIIAQIEDEYKEIEYILKQ